MLSGGHLLGGIGQRVMLGLVRDLVLSKIRFQLGLAVHFSLTSF
jgi:hypothetical protein